MIQVKFIDDYHFSNVQNAPDYDVKPNLLSFILLGVSFKYHDTNVFFLLTLVNNYTAKPVDTGRKQVFLFKFTPLRSRTCFAPHESLLSTPQLSGNCSVT